MFINSGGTFDTGIVSVGPNASISFDFEFETPVNCLASLTHVDEANLATAPLVSITGYPTSDKTDPEGQYSALSLAEESSATAIDGVNGIGTSRKMRYVNVMLANTQPKTAYIRVQVFGGSTYN